MFLKCAMLLVTSEILLNQFNYFHFFLTISNLTTEGFFDLNSSICLGMIAWPETIFLTDNGFFRPPATLALTVSPLGVSRDFVWNETRSISFSQGLRFQKS